ncbi:hypothetical protein Peternella1_46 [Winogradskyella phage Peternella_1]|uniref:Uncharacterized protein n=1 Tax=Winogradskyella phage Peternella_1 TaxID=2745699 RepID=A0A8E4ZE33_9CAUD|nr:hypothetical protein M1M32_gp46 [Winogradskyella phage Peternella_1]QQV91582.1 hypothetical protein Peternella1_46 [Winogradskyella phage Peternella_1]
MSDYSKFADITPEQNSQWEAKYGKHLLIDLEIEVDGRTYNYVLRKPDRAVLEAMGKHAVSKNVELTNKSLIKNCVLGGDMEALEKDGSVYVEVLEQLQKLKSEAKSTVKKR